MPVSNSAGVFPDGHWRSFSPAFFTNGWDRLCCGRLGSAPFTRPASDLNDGQTAALARLIKRWEIPVTGTQGMGGAQVTAGGIALAEVEPATLMSRKVPGLYLAGEVLDVDGDCGGFNLQWAWASAHAAASAMREAVRTGNEGMG